jgi:hypothetical protein
MRRNCRRLVKIVVQRITATLCIPGILVLKPHLRAPDQPKTRIDVVYGEAKGRFGLGAQAARSNLLLETVAQHVAGEFVWPVPFTLEMQSCGFPNARWDLSSRKLTLCYELAADFEELYRSYGAASPGTHYF